MNKIPKYVVIIAGILVMVVLLPLGYVRYKTRYEAEQISTSTSPDGDYELVIYSVGDPDFPFGAAHGRLVLKGKEKTVAYRSFEVANDGARFDESDLKTTWYIDRVEVVVSGAEQRDELVTLRFNGQTSSRRLTTRYRREDTDIEKDSEQDSAITEKASGDSRRAGGRWFAYAVSCLLVLAKFVILLGRVTPIDVAVQELLGGEQCRLRELLVKT